MMIYIYYGMEICDNAISSESRRVFELPDVHLLHRAKVTSEVLGCAYFLLGSAVNVIIKIFHPWVYLRRFLRLGLSVM